MNTRQFESESCGNWSPNSGHRRPVTQLSPEVFAERTANLLRATANLETWHVAESLMEERRDVSITTASILLDRGYLRKDNWREMARLPLGVLDAMASTQSAAVAGGFLANHGTASTMALRQGASKRSQKPLNI